MGVVEKISMHTTTYYPDSKIESVIISRGAIRFPRAI